MSAVAPSLVNFTGFSEQKIQQLFSLSDQILQKKISKQISGVIGLLFFEPSTRTRVSFEIAALRCGLRPFLFDGDNSSLEKGESLEDSFLNIAAMKPDLMVVRAGNNLPMTKLQQRVGIPLVNAGWGTLGHPTQALLDIYTLRRRWQDVRGKKFLLIGDIRHSRVAASHFELADILGYEIAICGAPEFLPETRKYKTFDRIAEGLEWADATLSLRVQLERHSQSYISKENEYRKDYGMTVENIRHLSDRAFILHPGPIHYSTDMEPEVLNDPRCLILDQVENGVHIREAVLRTLMEGAR